MKKSDVETRSGPYGGDPRGPCLNVKCYGNWPRRELARHFGIDYNAPELDTALEYAWESACEQFWEQAQDVANYALEGAERAEKLNGKPGRYTVYSAGRSGGWLVVEGLPDLETWDAIMLGRWAKFAKTIAADIAYRLGFDALRDDIEANEWLKPGAEKLNFVERKDGTTACIADLKAGAIAAGFGPAVRK